MKLDYVVGDDWEGLFIDGELYVEDHRISALTFLGLIKEQFGVEFKVSEANHDWLTDRGDFPIASQT